MDNQGEAMGFLEGLTLIFVVLKLTGIIAWSWWWVLAPMWPAVIIWLIVAVLFFVGVSGRRR